MMSDIHPALQDVLSICGSNLPPWTAALAGHCRFLFPFDLRRRFFYCTSFGFARALWHLQHQQVSPASPAAQPLCVCSGARGSTDRS